MVTQPGDPNNKSKPAYKNYCSYCHKNNHGVLNCYQTNAMKNIKYIKIKDQELLSNPLYNTSVVNPVVHKKIEMKIKMIILLKITTVIGIIKATTPITMTDIEITTDTEATVETIHKKNYRSNSRQRYYNRSQSPYPSRSRFDNYYQRKTHPDLHIEHHTKTTPTIKITLDQDIDLALNHMETP